VDIHPSAGKHGVADADVRHAVEHALNVVHIDDDPYRLLFIGPDRAGTVLEIIAIVAADARTVAIHAMPLRPKFARFLPR